MQHFSKFIVDNWKIILEICLLVLSIILLIIKKKPIKIVDSVKSILIGLLPQFISRAESYVDVFDPDRKISGEDKFKMVLHMCFSFMVEELGLKEEDLPSYTSWLSENIEAILNTPTKKGGLGRENETIEKSK